MKLVRQVTTAVGDATTAAIAVEKYLVATSQLAQTTLRAVLGKHELDEMLAEVIPWIRTELEAGRF